MTDDGAMYRERLTGLFHSLPKASRLKCIFKQVMRFTFIWGLGLYTYYLLTLVPACQFLTTPYEFLFCPLLMEIYAAEGELSFREHIWSLHSAFIAIVAATAVALWAMKESKPRI